MPNRYAIAEPLSISYGPADDPLDRAIEAVEWNTTYPAEVDAYMAEHDCTEERAVMWRAELLMRGEEP